MHSHLGALQPYPFEKLRDLLDGVSPAALPPIRLSIGEPQHATPSFIVDALVRHVDGLAVYPTTAGMDALREVIAGWCARRYVLDAIDPAHEVLPVNGSREALFAFAQCAIASGAGALVACPNPFYQIYEGAALLAGATPVFLNQTASNGFGLDFDALSPETWARVQLLYACSPGNPTGHVLTLDDWRRVFELADRYGFVIASDECYSEIYFDEAAAPLGGLAAAQQLGRDRFERLVVFGSLSKRSNVPGLRSGFVAGDRRLLGPFLRYRTYHGCAMGLAVQHASVAAWNDERHVADNRSLYRQKFDAVVPRLRPVMEVARPEAGFYLWAKVPPAWGDRDDLFARDLIAQANVAVLPGRYLAREAHGSNPGVGYVRMALVATFDACVAAADRIVAVARSEQQPYAHTHP